MSSITTNKALLNFDLNHLYTPRFRDSRSESREATRNTKDQRTLKKDIVVIRGNWSLAIIPVFSFFLPKVRHFNI